MVVVLCKPEDKRSFRSYHSDWAALFRIALPTPGYGEGPRKCGLKIACLTLPCPAYRGWRGSHTSGSNKRKKGLLQLNLGSWNVRTLLDRARIERPDRRTALVAKELARYHLDIVALSETRLAEEGQLAEDGAGYTFFWSGRPKDHEACHQAGVGFAIKTHLVNKLTSLPKGVSDRLMTLQLPLRRKQGSHPDQRLCSHYDKPRGSQGQVL